MIEEDTMDVVELLSDQHRQVELLFEQFQQATDTTTKANLARDVIVLLSKHSGVEEIDVYPVIKREISEAAAGSLTHEHQDLKQVLADIESAEPGTADFDQKMAKARMLVEQHVAEEEGQVFTLMRQKLDPDRLDLLAETVMAKWDGAPTHPHPNQPPANKVTGPVVGLVDKARDALKGD
jgi:hemerythrin superfamily protein